MTFPAEFVLDSDKKWWYKSEHEHINTNKNVKILNRNSECEEQYGFNGETKIMERQSYDQRSIA